VVASYATVTANELALFLTNTAYVLVDVFEIVQLHLGRDWTIWITKT
jgi:hypothetical protein